MLKTTIAFLIALAIAIGGGAYSLAYVLDETPGAGALSFGPWTALRALGSAEADPYARARISREGILALGEGEGLAFVAERDSNGARLRLDCTYRLEGSFPPTRFWTMYVEREGGAPSASGAIHSQQLLRRPDNTIAITVSRHAAPGNWLRAEGRGEMRIVATMYDFSIATQTDEPALPMPRITREGCDA